MGILRETKTWEHVLMTFLIVSFGGFLAIIFPNITNAFSIAGGSFGLALAIGFPIILYLKTDEQKWTSCKNLTVICSGMFVCTIAFSASIVSVLDTAKVIDLASLMCIP